MRYDMRENALSAFRGHDAEARRSPGKIASTLPHSSGRGDSGRPAQGDLFSARGLGRHPRKIAKQDYKRQQKGPREKLFIATRNRCNEVLPLLTPLADTNNPLTAHVLFERTEISTATARNRNTKTPLSHTARNRNCRPAPDQRAQTRRDLD